MIETCASCRFWDRYVDSTLGQDLGDCRRRAPVISDYILSRRIPQNVRNEMDEVELHLYEASAFPVTQLDSWCGEYEARPA